MAIHPHPLSATALLCNPDLAAVRLLLRGLFSFSVCSVLLAPTILRHRLFHPPHSLPRSPPRSASSTPASAPRLLRPPFLRHPLRLAITSPLSATSSPISSNSAPSYFLPVSDISLPNTSPRRSLITAPAKTAPSSLRLIPPVPYFPLRLYTLASQYRSTPHPRPLASLFTEATSRYLRTYYQPLQFLHLLFTHLLWKNSPSPPSTLPLRNSPLLSTPRKCLPHIFLTSDHPTAPLSPFSLPLSSPLPVPSSPSAPPPASPVLAPGCFSSLNFASSPPALELLSLSLHFLSCHQQTRPPFPPQLSPSRSLPSHLRAPPPAPLQTAPSIPSLLLYSHSTPHTHTNSLGIVHHQVT